MGTFALPPPATSAEIAGIETYYMISSTLSGLRKSMGDSNISTLDEFLWPSPIEMAYQSIYLSWVENLKSASPSVWVDRLLDFGMPSDPFSSMFLTNENILEAMMTEGEPWEDYHHHSHLPDNREDYSNELNHSSVVDFLSNFVFIDILDSK